ncbi:MAG: GntR family transcriptional regulator [Bacteroidales bacterium]|nr:GntR family transcriptional regulator [Bacteroidales bacterium]
MTESDNRPIYIRLADRICDMILTHEYHAMDKIPSIRDYAVAQQVNPATAARAFEMLERHGIIFNKRGLGSYISPDAEDIIKRIRIEALWGNESKLFFQRLAILGVTPDQLKEMFARFLENQDSNASC